MKRAPKRKQHKASKPRDAGHWSRGGNWIRATAASLLLIATVVGLYYLTKRPEPTIELPHLVKDFAASVRDVALRYRVSGERIVIESSARESGGTSVLVVKVNENTEVDRFVLEIEALIHNLGGRFERREVALGRKEEARLDCEVGGEKWQIQVVRETGSKVAMPTSGALSPQSAIAKMRVRGRLTIILDDAGNSLGAVKDIQNLPKAIAVAVLPNAAESSAVARELVAQGREILLHMPMETEPRTGAGPGEGAIQVALNREENEKRLEAALLIVKGARGINNHMGSRATRDEKTMHDVLRLIGRKGLYFLDSRTTPDTVGEKVARTLGVRTLHRDFFLDAEKGSEAIIKALNEAISRAQEVGSAVAIGHVHPETIEILRQELTRELDGVILVPPSVLAK